MDHPQQSDMAPEPPTEKVNACSLVQQLPVALERQEGTLSASRAPLSRSSSRSGDGRSSGNSHNQSPSEMHIHPLPYAESMRLGFDPVRSCFGYWSELRECLVVAEDLCVPMVSSPDVSTGGVRRCRCLGCSHRLPRKGTAPQSQSRYAANP